MLDEKNGIFMLFTPSGEKKVNMVMLQYEVKWQYFINLLYV